MKLDISHIIRFCLSCWLTLSVFASKDGSWNRLQHVTAEELALIATLVRDDVLKGLDGMSALNATGNMTIGDALIRGQQMVGGIPMSPALLSLAFKCIDSATQITTLLQAYRDYHGPLPVPTLNAFIALGKLIQETLGRCFLHVPTTISCMERDILYIHMSSVCLAIA